MRNERITRVLEAAPSTLKHLYMNYYGSPQNYRSNFETLTVPTRLILERFPNLRTLMVMGCRWTEIWGFINQFTNLQVLAFTPQ